MRPFALALLVTAAASAQAPERPDLHPSPAQRTVLGLAAFVGGVGAMAGTYALTPTWYDTPGGVTLLVLAYPAGLSLGTVLAAEALGLDPSLQHVAEDAVLGVIRGALAGVVVGGAVAGLVWLPTMELDYNFWPALVGGGVGVITVAVVTAWTPSRRVRVAPAALAAPTGETATGLSFSLSF